MYTGLIQEVGKLQSKISYQGFDTVYISTSEQFVAGLQVGGSVALNGICLSVTRVDKGGFFADVGQATAAITNFKHTKVEDAVNLERSALAHQEVGGHLIAGHVDCTGQVVEVIHTGQTLRLAIQLQKENLKYIFAKGFTAINGASLTIAEIDEDNCIAYVNLVPETLRNSTFSSICVADEVNIEIEPFTRIIVDTMHRILAR